MIEECVWIILGIAAGMFTGLAPGIHANTIAIICFYLPFEKNLGFAMFIVSMSITHSFLDSIPSILLGAPTDENSLNALPGHRMLLLGRGLEAINLMALGGVITTATALALSPAFFSFAKNYGDQLYLVVPWAIVGTILLMLLRERNRLAALITLSLAGLLGIFTLGSSIAQPIFPLIVGFFGLPELIQSALSKTKIPQQKKSVNQKINVNLGIVSAITSGFLAALPGIGPSQAMTIVSTFYRKLSEIEYLVLSGGINSANLVFSILMLYSLGKTRTGMAATLNGAIQLDSATTIILLLTALVSAGVCAATIGAVATASISLLKRIDYSNLSILVFLLMVLLVGIVSGLTGLAACAAATGISLLGQGYGARRSHCMAFLLLPTLMFYIGI